jgi:protein ImuB
MFACTFIPNFSVAAIYRAEPEIRAQALAIFEGKPPLEKICALNEKASHLGITPGMTKAQAELCPELILRARSALQETATHAALLDCAQSFSPCVEDSAMDTVIFDLGGMGSLFGPALKISQVVFHRAAGLGLDANVAIASNPDAAVLAARGFSGVTVIPAGKEAQRLGSLPLEVLFAGDGGNRNRNEDANNQESILLETLGRWGVRDLGTLAALPEVELSERLGQEGLRLQQLARGAAARTLVPVEEPMVFEEAIELEFPIVLLEPLAFLLNRLLEQICARLAGRAFNTQEMRLTLELENGYRRDSSASSRDSAFGDLPPTEEDCRSVPSSRTNQFQRTLQLPVPMLDAKLFLKLLQLDLNAHPPGAPIKKIHLAAEPARPRPGQGGLFLPPTPEPEKLELTLARIAGVVGEGCAGSIELLDTHHAEGFRMKHFANMQSAVQKNVRNSPPQAGSEGISPGSAVTALRIFRPSLRASVTLESGEPVRLSCSKKKEVQGTVLWKSGPWRSSGDWWKREAWSRDEWDIALQNSESVALYRLVHDLLGGGWFVEGTYD